MQDSINIIRTEKKHPLFGKITKIEFPNKSNIYLSDKGMTFTLPRRLSSYWLFIKKGFKFEILVDWNEVLLALKEEEIRTKEVNKR